MRPVHAGFRDALALLMGCACTLAVRGYQFGSSNHNVYLLAPLHQAFPFLLQHDWFTTQTLQYNGIFNLLCVPLMRLHIIEPVFLAGYLALVWLLHIAWQKWTFALGGGNRVYLLSVILFYFSAGGFGLGLYEFLQDRCFLPSNIAAVAMLWGFYFWAIGRKGWAGALLGLAGLFHLNYALIGIAIWSGLSVWSKQFDWRSAALLIFLSAWSVVPAARTILAQRQAMPLYEFVALYVRLRHPHHYDPSIWPIALWISFLWPIPLAIGGARKNSASPASRQTIRIFLLTIALLAIALLGAGIWYCSSSLIQMSLYRVSVYAKMLSCVGAALLLCRVGVPAHRSLGGGKWWAITPTLLAVICLIALGWPLPGTAGQFIAHNRPPLEIFTCLCIAIAAYPWIAASALRCAITTGALIALLISVWPLLGINWSNQVQDNSDYLTLCDWARAHTPADAVFLVPPQEESFRFHAQRAIVVNFKCVPQLAGELGQWRNRMQDVLNGPLTGIPQRFDLALAEIGRRFDNVPPNQLCMVARKYGATYLLTAHPLPTMPPAAFENASFHLYALNPRP